MKKTNQGKKMKKKNLFIVLLITTLIVLSFPYFLRGLKDKPIIIWPYMGHAPEILDIFDRVGAKVHRIPISMEPPDPTLKSTKRD